MSTHKVPHLAIIGGGFGGTMVLANLIASAKPATPLHITWFEDKHPLGTGLAYGTAGTPHLLNVRAGLMGAFADNPKGFFEWLQTPAGKKATSQRFPVQNITEESYVPRALYGDYLKHIAAETIALAKQKGIALDIKHAFVNDATLAQGSRLTLTYGTDTLTVDAAVLATGNQPPRTLPFLANLPSTNPYYVHDIWHPPLAFSKEHISALPVDSTIAIIGTGLTAVDAILSLKEMGFKGNITAISRGGWLPTVHKHRPYYPDWEWRTSPEKAPHTALGLLQGLRKEIAHAKTHNYNWRSVVDSLRPATQTLWRQLPLQEKKRFMQRLSTLWSIHRHRMAESIHQTLEDLQGSKKLHIISAKILSATPAKEGISITYKSKKNPVTGTLHATALVNCTGPDYALQHTKNQLLHNLYKNGLITAHPTGIGISMTDDVLFVVGPLQLGELLESIAVPEVREQAKSAAQMLLSRLGCC